MKEKKLRFYEKSHTYWLGKKKLESATTFISSFFEKFDNKAVARKLSKFWHNKKQKHGVRWFLKDWKERAESGTRIHERLEWYVTGEEPDCNHNNYTTTEDNKYEQGIIAIENIKQEHPEAILEAEVQLYDEELLLAGTIDLLVKTEKVINLYDYKTNKKLTKKGYEGKKGIKEPLLDIDDCHYTKYGLQLSLYAYMLERQGYEVGKLFLIHLMDGKHKVIELGYDKGLIKEMIKNDIKHRTENTTNKNI